MCKNLQGIHAVNETQTAVCRTNACPRTDKVSENGNWGEWSDFNACTEFGVQYRVRVCNKPIGTHDKQLCLDKDGKMKKTAFEMRAC